MTTPRDFYLRNYKPTLDAKQDKYEPFRAVITSANGSRTSGKIWKDENARLVWYQAWGSSSIGWALCDSIEPYIGLGVVIQFNQLIGYYEVMRDDPIQRSASSSRSSYRALTNEDFQQGGRFQLWLDPTMFVPLSIYPGTGGLKVSIVTGDYIYDNTRKTYDGTVDYDISAEQPAGPNEHNLVGLYLDSSNALNVVTGAATGSGFDAPEPTWPAGSFRLGVIDLNDTQTAIYITDITNRKVVWTEDNGTLTIALSDLTDVTITAPVADNEVLAYDTGSGKWINQTAAELSIDLDDLDDVTITAPVADNEVLAYDTGSSKWINQTAVELAIDLDDLADVDTTGVADGDALVYDSGTSTWLPGSAGGVWPLADKLTRTSDGAEYATFADLYAALDSDSHGLIGFGSFACDNEAVNDNLAFLGAGRVETVLYTSTKQRTLTLDGIHTVWENLKILNDYDSNNIWCLYCDNSANLEMRDCEIEAIAGAGNAAVAIRCVTGNYTLTLRDCVISATGGATNTALSCVVTGASTVNLIDCTIIGDVSAADANITLNINGGSITGALSVTGSTVNLINTPKITGTVTGTPAGQYTDTNNKLRRGSDGSVVFALDKFNSTSAIYEASALSDSDFVATIATLPGGAVLTYNAPSSGDERNLVSVSVGLAYMVLHNTTRGDEAFISTCVIATNTITLTAAVPGTWQVNDTITIRSTTNTATAGAGIYFVDFEIDTSAVTDDSDYVIFYCYLSDSGGSGRLVLHPFETNSNGKREAHRSQVAGLLFEYATVPLALITKRFCAAWDATGANTLQFGIKLFGIGQPIK